MRIPSPQLLAASTALACLTAMAAAGGPGTDLLQVDAAMNQDIAAQGNDIHAMRRFMADVDMGYSRRVHGFTNYHELAKQAPTVTNPEFVQSLQTRFAAVSADGGLGITYGIWNTADIGDQPLEPTDFYRGFVFGLRAGLWTAKWSPRGAPRHFYFRYIRIWQRQGPEKTWRLVAGPFGARADELASPSQSRSPAAVLEPVAALQGIPPDRLQAQAAVDIDTEFPAALRKYGLHYAYRRYAADDIRVLHEDRPEAANLGELLRQSEDRELKLDLRPVGSLVAASGDLRCDYGWAYYSGDKSAAKRMLYAHVWQYRAGAWKILFSYLEPIQE